MQKITKNNFTKGMSTDIDKNQLPPVYFTDSQNLEFTGDGVFLAAKNIRGTSNAPKVITASSGTLVLGMFETQYTINSVPNIKCLTIITATVSGDFKIWCLDIENNNLYEMYEEPVPSGYFTDDRVVDAVRYAENGLDILYYTDFFNEIRQLRCEIPFPYVANFLTENDISLQKRGANGTIELNAVADGGSLLSGTYQFAYRMVDPEKKKFTKWSSLTNPIHVYVTDSVNYLSNAGIGLPTDQKITIDVAPTDVELASYPNFQLAVVENIYPVSTSTTVASLLSVELIADITGFEYKANTKVGTIPIEDIVVDLAAIETAKTLSVKLNKLFAGNIKYRALELDNGTPQISGGEVIQVVDPTSTVHYDANNTSKYRGYFRDEVYRFGIVYYDKYGNHSAPVPLDLSSVTDNQITPFVGLVDMRFPNRQTSNTYSILDQFDSPRALGLSLEGIDNHPTWAVAFEIVRVKRIKKVLFQTPVIPMTTIEGVGAFRDYPSNAAIGAGLFREYPDAQPQTSSKVYVPKNLFWPENRKIMKRPADGSGGGASTRLKGEAVLARQATYDYAAIFPQPNMYGDTPYVFSGNEKLQTIDYFATKVDTEDFSAATITDRGNHINTKIAGNFYALRDGDYFLDSTHVKTITDADNQVVDYAFIDNLASGVVLAGEKVLQYNELSTEGVSLGYEPTNQKMAVVKLTDSYADEGSTARTFANITKNNYATGGLINTTGTLVFEDDTIDIGNYTNSFITDYSGYSENSSYVQALRIVNVIKGEIGDDRYGDPQDQHEYISTGAKYAFSTLELVDVAAGNSLPIDLEVWGGDCFVGYHIFKVSDSTYSVVNQTKNNGSPETTIDLLTKWGQLFLTTTSGTDAKLMLPVALEKVGQYVQVFLESEYNGEVRDYDVLVKKGASGDVPYFNVSSEGSIRTPLTYKYNINLSKQNDEKVYLSKPENFVEQNEFEARIVISDQKIYNSDIQGFDTFRVLSAFDLEESGGHITKLALAGDNLYAVQERKIVYLPVGATQIEQTNAGILSVGTGDDIGRPIVIDTNRGSQHLRAIVEAGGVLYVPDNRNKAIYAVSGTELSIISDQLNATYWREKFAVAAIPENQLIGVYDAIRKEYWVAHTGVSLGSLFCQRFNEVKNEWHGNIEIPSNLYAGVTTNQLLYLCGVDSGNIVVASMYTGDYGQMFGSSVTPRISFSVNPDGPLSKVFDNLMFEASDRLGEMDLVVVREQALGNQAVSGTILDIAPIENNYRIKILRDSGNARLRGLRMDATVKWKEGNFTSILSSVVTKYRPSARQPY